MYSIIICAHGDLAESLKRSAEMIFGKVQNVYPIRFVPGENQDDLKKKINQALQENDLQECLILTDLFCGSPYNAAAALAYEDKNLDVLAGVNLPLLLEAISNQNQKDLAGIIAYLKQVSPETIKFFSEMLKKSENEEDELL
ncbi:MAG: PTS sugar transporter subunit IIA [Sporolactobacillus sp.]